MNTRAAGITCALIGAALWGFSGACTQYLFAHSNATPLFITTVRMLGAGALFLVLLLAQKRALLARMLHDRASIMQLVVFGSVGLFACQVTYIIVIGITNAGTATVLQGLNMVFVLAASCVLGRRLPFVREACGVACAFVATLLIATKGDLGMLNIPLAGLVWGIVNAASVAFYVMYPKRLFEKWGSLPVTGCGMFIGGCASLVVMLVLAGADVAGLGTGAALHFLPQLEIDGVIALVAIVVLGTFAAFGLYLHGVSLVGSVTGSLLGAVEPVSATLFSALWLGTLFNWADWAGLVLMVLTVFLVSAKPTEH